MTTFMIPGSAFEGLTPFGASAPDAGYYEVSITKFEQHTGDRVGKRRLHISLPNGFGMFEFLDLAYDGEGNVLPGLTENQVAGRTRNLLTILNSLGYSMDEIRGGTVHDDWFITASTRRKAYIEFIPGQAGVKGSFSTINAWLSKERYEALKDSGDSPVAKESRKSAPAVTAAPSPVSSAPVPTNGVSQAAPQLPPPPSAAQAIVR